MKLEWEIRHGNTGENRQGRMALHAEAPSSKAKREQALRNILAARRRQLLNSRVSEVSKILSPSRRTPRPVLAVSKDPPDMLEAQETRHGVYVTAPIGDEVSVIMDNDEDDALELLTKGNLSRATSTIPEIIEKPSEETNESTKNSLLLRINETDPWTLAESKTSEGGSKNTSQTLARSQQILEHENRRKNTVAMPESLYNHFRPVESNIPVEDMSQFLYFGQKLHPDIQNSTSRSNNSLLDVTSTSSSIPSSRRRYSMKRFSTTTAIALPRLEDIMNEEMNIALERGTIERNKIPKTKNVFRSPGSGTYFRKSSMRPSDSTIVSNVIINRETARNTSVQSDNRREIVLSRNPGKFVGDSSAHAKTDQVAIVSDRGSNARVDTIAAATSATSHRAGNVTSGNVADLTQFQVDPTNKDESQHQRGENLGARDNDDKRQNSTNVQMTKFLDESVSQSSILRDDSTMQTTSTSRNELINGITTWQSVYSNHETTTFSANNDPDKDSISSTINDLAGTSYAKISSTVPTLTTNIAHSSLRIVVTEPMGYATGVVRPSSQVEEEKEVVEEENDDDGRGKEIENDKKSRGKSRTTVNRTDSRKNRTIPRLDDIPYRPKFFLFTSTILPLVSSTDNITENLSESRQILSSYPMKSLNQRPSVKPINFTVSTSTEKNEYKQQHAYAYEITNVTRLLRNYTGPGLNVASGQQLKENKMRKESEEDEERKEERRKNTSNKKEKKNHEDRVVGEAARGKETESGSALTRINNAGSNTEIRNDGESVKPKSQRQPLPLLLLLPTLQRETSSRSSNVGGSGGGIVEPARSPGQLSAGTNVGEVTASSSGDDGVSERGDGRSGGSDIETSNTLPLAFPTIVTSLLSRDSNVLIVEPASTTSLPKDRNNVSNETTESTILPSTLRWNYTLTNKLPIVVDRTESQLNDRRYLRKSASAVINQRTIDEGLVKEIKRRRGSLSGVTLFASSSNNRRVKGSRNSGEDTKLTVARSMENRTSSDNSEKTSTSKTIVDENALSVGTDKFIEVSDTMTEMEVTVGLSNKINRTVETTKFPDIGTTVASPSTLDSPIKKQMEHATRDIENIENPIVNVRIDEAKSLRRTSGNDQVNLGDSSSGVTNVKTNTNLTSVGSFSALKSPDVEISVDRTTIPSPVFPVTPRMLAEPVDTTSNDNTKSSDETKVEAGRPFGLAKDLDPSEIQKMYRSQTTLKPEIVATTIVPEFEITTDVDEGSTVSEQSWTTSPVNSITRKPISTGERSPEVRGRNLSDKSKDKDDILPIMQLYNTSNIFNGTGKDSSDSTNNVGSLELPVINVANKTSHENHSEPAITATTTMAMGDDLENGESPVNESKVEHSSENSGISRKNNRHGSNRDYTNGYASPTKSSNVTGYGNSSNFGQTNRTRHWPNYYQTPPTEFVGYRPEFNSSFYEPGMISVSPRESINISEVITKRHDGDTIATQETVAVVSYILATLVVFPIAVGVGLILRRLIIRNRKVLEESDTSSEISCRKDALNLENGDFKTSIEKAITKLPRIQHLCHEAEKPPPPPSQESRWEFPRDKLRLQTVLGQGNFGQVWKAEADDLTGHQGTTRLVAVKTVKEGASSREKEDLVRELEIMQQLGNHPNVVTLLGCCTEEEPHYLILEYVMYGKLLAYLRDHRTRQDFYNFSEDSAALTSRDLTVFGYCVARGMEYLASKKIIHRDLAARNVLVDHNKLCKIADFGMSRFANSDGEVIEARHGRNALPIRWMAPESLIYSLFTTKTDVWSFGILMWEIVTLGSTPYPDMAAREVMRNVQNGYRLERPSHCRSELFRVISRCWHADPDRRPEFQILRRDMAQLLEDSMNGHYVDLESFASECTD